MSTSTIATLRRMANDIARNLEAMGPDQAVLLAGQVTDAIGGIVANCELEPEADAVLHVVLATLGQAATELKQDPTGHAPIATMRQALADYARLFDDSGFEAP